MDNTWKLIPKSKPTFQKILSEIFEFKKILQRATIFAFIFVHFLGAHWKLVQTNANSYQVIPTDANWCQGTWEGQIRPFSAVSGPISAIFQLFLAEFLPKMKSTLLDFSEIVAIFDVSPTFLGVFLAIFDVFFGYFWRFPGYFRRFF